MTPEDVRKRLACLPEPDWIRQMREHYRRTGVYRVEDVRRVLGDPTKGVEVAPQGSVPRNLLRESH